MKAKPQPEQSSQHSNTAWAREVSQPPAEVKLRFSLKPPIAIPNTRAEVRNEQAALALPDQAAF